MSSILIRASKQISGASFMCTRETGKRLELGTAAGIKAFRPLRVAGLIRPVNVIGSVQALGRKLRDIAAVSNSFNWLSDGGSRNVLQLLSGLLQARRLEGGMTAMKQLKTLLLVALTTVALAM